MQICWPRFLLSFRELSEEEGGGGGWKGDAPNTTPFLRSIGDAQSDPRRHLFPKRGRICLILFRDVDDAASGCQRISFSTSVKIGREKDWNPEKNPLYPKAIERIDAFLRQKEIDEKSVAAVSSSTNYTEFNRKYISDY